MLCKFTDKDGRTKNNTQWGPGVTHEARPGDGDLCTDRWIHWYADPLVAEFMNPIHGEFDDDAILWEIAVDGKTRNDNWLKCGAKSVTTIRSIPRVRMTTTQRVAAAIHLAKMTLEQTGQVVPEWDTWADDWLTSAERTTWSAARSAAWSAERTAWSAARVARSAANAAQGAARSAAHRAASATMFPSMLMLALGAAMDIE